MLQQETKKPDFGKIFNSSIFRELVGDLEAILTKIDSVKENNPILETIYINIYNLLNFKLKVNKDGTLNPPIYKQSYFDRRYSGIAPWDYNKPHTVIKELVQKKGINGRVLDMGCGTGNDAIFLALKGFEVVGIDFSTLAIKKAKEKIKDKKLELKFLEEDVFNITSYIGTFDTIIDCGLFHGLTENLKESYVKILSQLLNKKGVFYLLCFSSLMPETFCPQRVSQREINEFFSDGWSIDSIEKRGLEGAIGDALIWLATIKKI
ncbi:MAG: class I SAM-dependent methyltransferase [Candidatus Lokiarchaeota archaeon]|nr:class I SAM-dependent methyltransferase [Candidatus Lokiarchaeota archaeon]